MQKYVHALTTVCQQVFFNEIKDLYRSNINIILF